MNESYPFHVIDLMKDHGRGEGEIRCPPRAMGGRLRCPSKALMYSILSCYKSKGIKEDAGLWYGLEVC